MYVIATVICPNFHFSVSPHVPFLNLLFEQIANSNEYLLAKFGFDTAETEPCKVCRPSASSGRPQRFKCGAAAPDQQTDTCPASCEPSSADTVSWATSLHALAKLGKLTNFANFWQARSWLYRNEILQANMRSKALAEIYTVHNAHAGRHPGAHARA